MDTLSDMLGTVDTTTLPGQRLVTGTLSDYAEFETFLVVRYLARVEQTAVLLEKAGQPAAAAAARREGHMIVAAETFAWPRAGYTAGFNNRSLLPQVLAINLRHSLPDVTPAIASRMLTPANRDAVWRRMAELWELTVGDDADPKDGPPPAGGTDLGGFTSSSAGTEGLPPSRSGASPSSS